VTCVAFCFALSYCFGSCDFARKIHANSPASGSDDLVMWSDVYTIVEATNDEIHSLQDQMAIPLEEVTLVLERSVADAPQVFRLPARYREELMARQVAVISNPPFYLVDPLIHERRASDDFAVWMSGYKDEVIVEKMLRRLARDYPDITALYEVGRSHEGRPIFALKISDNPSLDEDEPAFLFNAAHHGNELLAPEYVLDLARFMLSGRGSFGETRWFDFMYESTNGVGTVHYRRPEIQTMIENFELWFVPVVNPDGLHVAWNRGYWSGRKNARDTTSPRGRWNKGDGVDLNRNYPFYWNSGFEKASSGRPGSIFYRGRAAGSEPETRAIMGLAERQRFAVSLSYHCYATKILVPYTIDLAVSPNPNPAWRIGQELARAGISHRPVKRYTAERNLYAVDGTDQDWLYNRFGTMAFIIEGSYLTPDYEPRARRSIQGMRPLSLRALELYAEGPALIIHVVDEQNRPTQARVEIVEFDYIENEAFTTHPRNGRFDYFLNSGGDYTLRVSKPGYQWLETRVECQSGHCPVSLKLTPDPARPN
jgi:murein tripeptide amidase MpaA